MRSSRWQTVGALVASLAWATHAKPVFLAPVAVLPGPEGTLYVGQIGRAHV